MKKVMIFLFIVAVISPISYADEGCLFPPCPPPPTEDEVRAVDETFKKARYILGAAFDVQNKRDEYNNIPDFVNRTKRLKQDIETLESEAKLLNIQAGGIDLVGALGTIKLCVSFSQNAIDFCHQALNLLKNHLWENNFGGHWSGYPPMTEWNGFPDFMK